MRKIHMNVDKHIFGWNIKNCFLNLIICSYFFNEKLNLTLTLVLLTNTRYGRTVISYLKYES